ncbi:MAG: EamA family transporter [Halanaerobiaceae bacterium]
MWHQKHSSQLKNFINVKITFVGFFLAVHFYLWISAFEYTSVANAVIFIPLQPLFTYILEYFFAKDDLQIVFLKKSRSNIYLSELKED